MSVIVQLYQSVFYQPIFNLLVFFYNVIPGTDIGIAILALTVLVRLILLPLSLQSIKSQRAMQQMQPKLRALQEEFKGDKEKLSRATMELYAKEKVNPLSSCLPLLIQLPFFLAIYQAMRNGLGQKLSLLYAFVPNPGTIEPIAFGMLNLAAPSIPLAVLAGVSQYFQTKMMMPPPSDASGKNDTMAMMNKQMVYVMPAVTVFIGARLPGGLALYWLLTNLLTMLQQWYFFSRK